MDEVQLIGKQRSLLRNPPQKDPRPIGFIWTRELPRKIRQHNVYHNENKYHVKYSSDGSLQTVLLQTQEDYNADDNVGFLTSTGETEKRRTIVMNKII